MKVLLLLLLFTFHPSLVTFGIADDEICQTGTVRDGNGNVVARISGTATGKIIRDSDGKILGRVAETATGRVIRDKNGKIIGKIAPSR